MDNKVEDTKNVDQSNFSLEEFFNFLRTIERIFEKISKNKPISSSQYQAMRIISQSQECTMSKLAKGLNLSFAAATQLVDRMVEAQLVQRSNSTKDRRKVIIHLSNVGNLELKRIQIALNKISMEIVSKIPKKELNIFLNMLQFVHESLKNSI
ncbi:MAG: MarR family transcriptional regulator [Candidatus Dojkabacteria bacterium]|nr:MarR family transcriptional regulator [Candidatus Dojkabacteria bacterium]